MPAKDSSLNKENHPGPLRQAEVAADGRTEER